MRNSKVITRSLASAEGQALSPPAGAGPDIPDCWSKIGVYGQGSCPELQQHIHCRNCPVYSDAGVQLLERTPPPEYRRERTEVFAMEKKAGVVSKTSAVLFRIETEWLALPTQAFQEVAERRRIHSLPHQRQGLLLGLANVRGELLICFSLGHLLGLEKIAPRATLRTTHHRLLVTSWDGSRLAFPVDEVLGIHHFHPQELKPPPVTLAKASSAHTQGVLHWRERTVGFLDAGLLFSTLTRALM